MQKSPFSRLMEEVDNEVMSLLGSYIHRRNFEETELRDKMNRTIGSITEKYNSYLSQSHPVETSIVTMLSNMAASKNGRFDARVFFNEECDTYSMVLKPYVETLDRKLQERWKSFIDDWVSKGELSYPQEFGEMLEEMADLVEKSPSRAFDNKAAMKGTIMQLLSEDSSNLLREIREDNGKSTKDIFYDAFLKTEMMKDSANLSLYAKEIESLTRSRDGHARSIVQATNEERAAVSFFAVLNVARSEKALTIEESLKKMNEASRGAVSRFKDYSISIDGKKMEMKDIFGVGTPLDRFNERIAQAELVAAASTKKKEPEKEYASHKEKVLAVLKENMDKSIARNKAKEAKEYVRNLYSLLIEAANRLPELTPENAMMADLKDSQVFEMVKEYAQSLSAEELQIMEGQFDRIPDELVNDEFRELRTICAEHRESLREQKENTAELERTIEEE